MLSLLASDASCSVAEMLQLVNAREANSSAAPSITDELQPGSLAWKLNLRIPFEQPAEDTVEEQRDVAAAAVDVLTRASVKELSEKKVVLRSNQIERKARRESQHQIPTTHAPAAISLRNEIIR
eukprot:4529155-Pleurochrysis_carterae.AAC.1